MKILWHTVPPKLTTIPYSTCLPSWREPILGPACAEWESGGDPLMCLHESCRSITMWGLKRLWEAEGYRVG